jgi:hypothetical protein
METKSRLNRFQLGVLLAPGLIVFATFTVYPIFRLLWMSFCDWSFGSMLAQPWIGLANYRAVLGDDTFWVVFVNSVVYTLVTVPGQMAVGLFVALLLNGIRRFSVGFPGDQLPAGDHLVGHRVAGVPLYFQHRRAAELLPDQHHRHYGAKRALAGQPVERHVRGDASGHLEGRGLEHGGVPGGAPAGAS